MQSAINYFHDCRTVESVKARYRELAKAHHPDTGGDEETMKAINEAYHKKLENLDGTTSTGTDGQEHTYHYNHDNEDAIMQKIGEVIAKLSGKAELWLIGTWIWVFDTEKGDGNNEILKAAGFRWNRNRSAWTWKPYKGYTRKSNRSIADIAATYGAAKYAYREDTKRSGRQAQMRLA